MEVDRSRADPVTACTDADGQSLGSERRKGSKNTVRRALYSDTVSFDVVRSRRPIPAR